MKQTLYMLAAIAGFILLGTGCKKDNTSNTLTQYGNLYFHLHTNIGTNEVDDYGDVNTDTSGRKIALTMAQLYISGIRFIKTDGSAVALDSVIILKTLDAETYFVAKVPTGNYQSVSFNVGLNATSNAKTPGTADTALNHPEMWFGSTAQPDGYKFLSLAGTIDTTAAANGTTAQMQPFSYAIGTAARLTAVTMPSHATYLVSTTQDAYVHITIDYSRLFTGLQLSNAANLKVLSTTDNSGTAATTIANNIPSMFRYEE